MNSGIINTIGNLQNSTIIYRFFYWTKSLLDKEEDQIDISSTKYLKNVICSMWKGMAQGEVINLSEHWKEI